MPHSTQKEGHANIDSSAVCSSCRSVGYAEHELRSRDAESRGLVSYALICQGAKPNASSASDRGCVSISAASMAASANIRHTDA